MKTKTKLFVLLCCSFLCLTLLCVFRIVPSKILWKDYKTVYVEKNYSSKAVMDAFSSQGITGVLSFREPGEKQKSPFVPVLLSVKFNGFSFVDLQNAYFTDKTGNYRLYYVPSKFSKKIPAVLSKITASCGSNVEPRFPFFSVCLVVLYFIFLLFYSKKKLFFTAIAFPFVFLSFCAPLMHICAIVILFVTVLFLFQNYWNREGYIGVLLHQKLFFIAIGVFSLFAIFSGLHVFILFCLASIGSTLFVLFYNELHSILYQKAYIRPVYIKKAINIDIKKSIKSVFFIVETIFTLLIFPGSLFFNGFLVSENSKELYIPGPSEYTYGKGFNIENYQKGINKSVKSKNSLPSLVDYIGADWYIETAPYSRLPISGTGNTENYIPLVGASVDMPDFKTENHTVQSKKLYHKVFDSDFLSEKLHSIDSDSTIYEAEKLLYSEGSFVSGIWTNINTIYIGIKAYAFAMGSLFLAFLMPIYLKRKKEKVL